MNVSAVIKIENLYKSYDNVKAVNGITLSIEKGELFGLVGPDGAGKTTTIRILCGLQSFEEGFVRLFGKDVVKKKNDVQKSIGYLSQKFSLYGDLTIDENIEFFAEIHDVRNYKERRDELLRFTRLIDFRKRLADNLSGGMKQKLALACALIHKPQILFLDEPTTGVDPVSRRDFWKILSSLLKGGMTILLTTPYLDEAERCNRVAMMNRGKIIALDTPKLIKQSIAKEVVEVVCNPVKRAYEIIKSKTGFDVQMFGDRIDIVLDNYEEDYPSIKSLLEENEVTVEDSRTITPSLENVFMYKIKEAG